MNNKRSWERQSCHCPVVIQQATQQSVAYVRDLSRKGIGLIHNNPIETGLAAIDVYPGHDNVPVRTHVHLTWCIRSIDDGYRSGGHFFDMVE
ncbi:PilZ domain-containing protein [Planctomycetota bacterium]